MTLSRRTFVGIGAGIAGTTLLPRGLAFGESAVEPHYFLEILVRPGWDPSYLFDARPLAMTAAGIAHNYTGAEPTELRDDRGGRTLVPPAFAALAPHFSAGRFSILNGVHMAASFDGHEQNLNYSLTGNPFGGESFVPHLNAGADAAPLDYLQLGPLFGANVTNAGRSAPLDARGGGRLVKAVAARAPLSSASPVASYVMRRLAALGSGAGAFARGARSMQSGLEGAAGLAENLKRIKLADIPAGTGEVPLATTLEYLRQCFGSGVVRSAVIEMQRGIDTHDPAGAKKQPDVYKAIAAEIAQVIAFLAETPVSETDAAPLLSRTTLVVTSEFGRTLRQAGLPIDNTGTDHNPLCNSVLLGGRGITGGLVIGAGDQQSALGPISGAHTGLDPQLVKTMGRPFDFEAMAPTDLLPPHYDAAHYLTFASVANSLYALFGVPASRYWTLGRNAPVARTLGAALVAV